MRKRKMTMEATSSSPTPSSLKLKLKLPKQRRQSFSLKDKLSIMRELDSCPPSDVARRWNLSSSMLSSMRKRRDQMSLLAEQSLLFPERKRLFNVPFLKVNTKLSSWLSDAQQKGQRVSSLILKQKAKEFAAQLGLHSFDASNSWLNSFQKRHCSKLSEPPSKCVGAVAVPLKTLLGRYHPQDVFGVTATALLYQLTPDRLPSDPRGRGKEEEPRLTVVLCCNADGTEKRRPLLVGSQKLHSRLSSDTVIDAAKNYRHQNQGQLTNELFREWVQQLDQDALAQGRHVLLLTDSNCAVATTTNLTNVQLVSLSEAEDGLNLPSSSAARRSGKPMDQGIVRSFKILYRRKMLERLLAEDRSVTVLLECKGDLRSTVELVETAWMALSPVTVVAAWRRSGLYSTGCNAKDLVDTVETSCTDGQMWRRVSALLRLPAAVTFARYVDCDRALPTVVSVTEEDVVEEGKDDEVMAVDGGVTPSATVSSTEVFGCVETLRAFLAQNVTVSGSVNCGLNAIEDYITSCVLEDASEPRIGEKPSAGNAVTSIPLRVATIKRERKEQVDHKVVISPVAPPLSKNIADSSVWERSSDASSADEPSSRPSSQVSTSDNHDIPSSSSSSANPSLHDMRDPDVLYTLSLVGRLKKFDPQRRALAQLRMQQVMYEVEFGAI